MRQYPLKTINAVMAQKATTVPWAPMELRDHWRSDIPRSVNDPLLMFMQVTTITGPGAELLNERMNIAYAKCLSHMAILYTSILEKWELSDKRHIAPHGEKEYDDATSWLISIINDIAVLSDFLGGTNLSNKKYDLARDSFDKLLISAMDALTCFAFEDIIDGEDHKLLDASEAFGYLTKTIKDFYDNFDVAELSFNLEAMCGDKCAYVCLLWVLKKVLDAPGKGIDCYVKDVRDELRGADLRLSNGTGAFLKTFQILSESTRTSLSAQDIWDSMPAPQWVSHLPFSELHAKILDGAKVKHTPRLDGMLKILHIHHNEDWERFLQPLFTPGHSAPKRRGSISRIQRTPVSYALVAEEEEFCLTVTSIKASSLQLFLKEGRVIQPSKISIEICIGSQVKRVDLIYYPKDFEWRADDSLVTKLSFVWKPDVTLCECLIRHQGAEALSLSKRYGSVSIPLLQIDPIVTRKTYEVVFFSQAEEERMLIHKSKQEALGETFSPPSICATLVIV
jgi:hypothetical protein